MLDITWLLVCGAAAASAEIVPFERRGTDGPPDAELVREAAQGKRAAQHALYLRHCTRVRTRVTRLLGRSAEVDDVLQDTFVEAFRDLQQLLDVERFGSWVCGIAVHQVHRRLRRGRLLRRLGLDSCEPDSGMFEVSDAAASPELLAQVRRLESALSRVSDPRRIAWILRHVEGCSLEETAIQCNVSLATIKRHLAAAEAELQQVLFPNGDHDEFT